MEEFCVSFKSYFFANSEHGRLFHRKKPHSNMTVNHWMSKSLNMFIKTCFIKRNKNLFRAFMLFILFIYCWVLPRLLYFIIQLCLILYWQLSNIFRILLNIYEGGFCKKRKRFLVPFLLTFNRFSRTDLVFPLLALKV